MKNENLEQENHRLSDTEVTPVFAGLPESTRTSIEAMMGNLVNEARNVHGFDPIEYNHCYFDVKEALSIWIGSSRRLLPTDGRELVAFLRRDRYEGATGWPELQRFDPRCRVQCGPVIATWKATGWRTHGDEGWGREAPIKAKSVNVVLYQDGEAIGSAKFRAFWVRRPMDSTTFFFLADETAELAHLALPMLEYYCAEDMGFFGYERIVHFDSLLMAKKFATYGRWIDPINAVIDLLFGNGGYDAMILKTFPLEFIGMLPDDNPVPEMRQALERRQGAMRRYYRRALGVDPIFSDKNHEWMARPFFRS